MMKKITIVIILCAATAFANPAEATLTQINLTADGLGLKAGNIGTSLATGDLQITGLTHIKLEEINKGILYLDKKGLSVQNLLGKGSTTISGKDSEQNEAVVFNFSSLVSAVSLSVGLNDYSSRNDDPVAMLRIGSLLLVREYK
jgi:hypothetical protein